MSGAHLQGIKVTQTKPVSDYPQYIFNLLTYMGVSRTKITHSSSSGKFTTEVTKGIPWTIYALFHINTWIKGLFLLGFFSGLWKKLNFKAFDDVQFFDNIAGLLWFIIFMEICTADQLLMGRYPFFEVLTAGWKVQNEIQEHLGPKGEHFKKAQDTSAIKKVWFQWIIILMGICACAIQYASAPKYCMFTNSLIEYDSQVIDWFMSIHDVGFIVHAWMNYGSDVAIQSVFGGQLQHSLRFLTTELEILTTDLEEAHDYMNPDRKNVNPIIIRINSSDTGKSDAHVIDCDNSGNSGHNSSEFRKDDRKGSSNYTIETILADYVKLYIYADRMNAEFCNNFLFMHVISYVQMTCDVFVVFQLLRTPGSTFTDVFYFMEDCNVCMYLLFKCFKAISFVGVAAEDFMKAFQNYMIREDPQRKVHRRVFSSMKKVVMKLGPNICGPWTVGNALTILISYYILVALWPET